MRSRYSSRSSVSRFLAALRIPAITIGVLLVPFAIYFFHVRAQREYLTSRNFRSLAMMSDQIKAMVNNYQAVIGNACLAVRLGPIVPSADPNKPGQKPVLEYFLKQAGLEVLK